MSRRCDPTSLSRFPSATKTASCRDATTTWFRSDQPGNIPLSADSIAGPNISYGGQIIDGALLYHRGGSGSHGQGLASFEREKLFTTTWLHHLSHPGIDPRGPNLAGPLRAIRCGSLMTAHWSRMRSTCVNRSCTPSECGGGVITPLCRLCPAISEESLIQLERI